MPIQWFVSPDGENKSGPYTEKELANFAKDGQIKLTDLVWREGMKDWVPARKLKGLFPTTNKAKSPTEEPVSTSKIKPSRGDPIGPSKKKTSKKAMLSCSSCERANPPDALFCVGCGNKLGEETEDDGPPVQESAAVGWGIAVTAGILGVPLYGLVLLKVLYDVLHGSFLLPLTSIVAFPLSVLFALHIWKSDSEQRLSGTVGVLLLAIIWQPTYAIVLPIRAGLREMELAKLKADAKAEETARDKADEKTAVIEKEDPNAEPLINDDAGKQEPNRAELGPIPNKKKPNDPTEMSLLGTLCTLAFAALFGIAVLQVLWERGTKCKHCESDIPRWAKVCRFCGRDR